MVGHEGEGVFECLKSALDWISWCSSHFWRWARRTAFSRKVGMTETKYDLSAALGERRCELDREARSKDIDSAAFSLDLTAGAEGVWDLYQKPWWPMFSGFSGRETVCMVDIFTDIAMGYPDGSGQGAGQGR